MVAFKETLMLSGVIVVERRKSRSERGLILTRLVAGEPGRNQEDTNMKVSSGRNELW
jgi:hypothetical protein